LFSFNFSVYLMSLTPVKTEVEVLEQAVEEEYEEEYEEVIEPLDYVYRRRDVGISFWHIILTMTRRILNLYGRL